MYWDTTITHTITTNSFHTFTVVVDNTNNKVSLYDNGDLIKSYDITLYYTTANYQLDWKFGPTSNRRLSGNGYMSRLYTKSLSSQEILHNYQVDYDKFYEEPTS